jgi:hypothetical protein
MVGGWEVASSPVVLPADLLTPMALLCWSNLGENRLFLFPCCTLFLDVFW